MKKLIVAVMAAAMFLSPVMSTAQAVEPLRKDKELTERYRRYRGRGRRHRGGSGGWIAAGVLGAALVGTAIASSNRPRTTYVYEQPSPVVVPSTPTYVYPSSPTYVYQGAPVVQDPNVYVRDANGNLVPYYQ